MSATVAPGRRASAVTTSSTRSFDTRACASSMRTHSAADLAPSCARAEGQKAAAVKNARINAEAERGGTFMASVMTARPDGLKPPRGLPRRGAPLASGDR